MHRIKINYLRYTGRAVKYNETHFGNNLYFLFLLLSTKNKMQTYIILVTFLYKYRYDFIV